MAILNNLKPDVETNIESSTDFSFGEDAATLTALLGNFLYSDKEYCVISELSANSLDAHAEVGKLSKPFKISLPTSLVPEFRIRDFGTGMSRADILKYLSKYGNSSKRHTNSRIGKYGIGSKSPSAVSDTWSITSYHKNKQYTYEVFIKETGIPSLYPVFEGDTEDESGLEIAIPISNVNTNKWIDAAKRAYKHYSVLPIHNGTIDLKPIEYLFKHDGLFGIVKSSSNSNIKVITTLREYSLDFESIKSHLTEEQLDVFTIKYGYSLNLFFEIGEIDLSISREQIQFNKHTIDNIKKKLDAVIKFVNDEYSVAHSQKTHIDFICSAREIYDKIPLNKIAIRALKNNSFSQIITHINDLLVLTIGTNISKSSDISLVNRDKRISITSKQNYTGINFSTDKTFKIDTQKYKKCIFVIRDTRDTIGRVIKEKNNNPDNFYIVIPEKTTLTSGTCINASSLEKPDKKIRIVQTKVRKEYVIKRGKWVLKSKYDNSNHMNLPIIEIEIKRVSEFVNLPKNLGILYDNHLVHVIGITNGKSSTLTTDDFIQREWIKCEHKFNDAVNQQFYSELNKNDLIHLFLKKRLNSNYVNAKLAAYSLVEQTINNSELKTILIYAKLIGKNIPHIDIEVETLIDDLHSRYSMLKYVYMLKRYDVTSNILNDVQAYINLIDRGML
jgi:hypothetical protein